jgi:two-component system, chemotaxis family, response regulator Rcp1
VAKGRKLRVLLAEDNRGDILLVEEALAHHGLEADLVVHRDGEEMLGTIVRIDAGELPCPDVVLLDLNLPRLNGQQLLKRMRESPLCGRMPVIIVTSSDARQDREATSRLGASAYFRKPSDYDEFLQLGALVREVVGTQGGVQ